MKKLPEARGTGLGDDGRVEVALDDHEVFKVVGHATLFQDGLDDGEDAVGPLEHEQGELMGVGEGENLAVHALAAVGTAQVDGLAGEINRGGHGGRHDDGGHGRARLLVVRHSLAGQQHGADGTQQNAGKETESGMFFHNWRQR